MNTSHHIVKFRGGPLDGRNTCVSPLELGTEIRMGGTINTEDYTVLVEAFYQIVEAESVEVSGPSTRTLFADFVKEFRHPLPLVVDEAAAR